MKVSLIGCGKIGTLIAEGIGNHHAGNTTLVSILDHNREKASTVAERSHAKVATTVQEILDDSNVQLVIEAASRSAVRDLGLRIIESGKHIMVMRTWCPSE